MTTEARPPDGQRQRREVRWFPLNDTAHAKSRATIPADQLTEDQFEAGPCLCLHQGWRASSLDMPQFPDPETTTPSEQNTLLLTCDVVNRTRAGLRT